MGAPANRCYEFSRRWVARGHRVSVVCGIPNHPTGKLYPGYSKKLLQHEVIEGIHVYRSWVFVTPNAGTVKRAFNFLSYACSSIIASEVIRDVDIVIASSPQFLTGVSGVLVQHAKRIPLCLEIRDLYPDSIDAVNASLPSFIMRALRYIEKKLYYAADRIVIVSDGFREHIRAIGIDDRKVRTVPNGSSPMNGRAPFGKENAILKNLSAETFLVTYQGTIGMAHGLEVVLESARRLESIPDIRFLLVGEGAEKAQLQKQAINCENVTFVDRQPRNIVAEIQRRSDAALVLLRKNPLFKTVIPSKMFEAMGAGTPLIVGVEGEAKKILDAAEAGIAIEPENAAALTAAIEYLYANRKEGKAFGKRGKSFVEKYFNLDALAIQYLDVLEAMVEPCL